MKIRHLLFCISILTLSLCSFANPIDHNTAQQAALHFLQAKRHASVQNLINIPLPSAIVSPSQNRQNQSGLNSDALYIFNADNGFVIIAGDDASVPVVAYSNEGNFDAGQLPDAMIELLQSYVAQINYIQEHQIEATQDIRESWQALSSGRFRSESDTRTVNALIQTHWSQSPYTNLFCPYDANENERTIAGCVAICMAQIIRYWQWPAHGFGSHEYIHPVYGYQSADFANTNYAYQQMPDILDNNSSQASKEAVSTLVYQCGVSVEMDYGTEGSAAYSLGNAPSAYAALRSNFGFINAAGIHRYLYSQNVWINRLKEQLDLLQPVYYSASSDEGGHAFIIDGYDSNDFFHVNWGWGGAYDAYYSISNLNPHTYLFNEGHTAIIEIAPAYSAAIVKSSDQYSFLATYNDTDSCLISGINTTDSIYASGNSYFKVSSDKTNWHEQCALSSTGGWLYMRYYNSGEYFRTDTIRLNSTDASTQLIFTTGYANGYTITSSATGHGSINPNGIIHITPYTSKTYYFIPESGYKLNQLIIDDNPVAFSGSSYTFQFIAQNHTISAEFRSSSPSIYKTADSLVFSCHPMDSSLSQSFNLLCLDMDQGSVNLVADNPFQISLDAIHWQNSCTLVNDTCNVFVRYCPTSGNESCGHLYIIPSAYTIYDTVTLIGIPKQYNIDLYHTSGGTITPAIENYMADYGESCTFAFTPDEGYKILSVVVDNEDMGVINSFSFDFIDRSHYIYVFFQSTVGIENESTNQLSVYPNPATDFVIVNLPDGYEEGMLSIYDLKGSLVMKQQIHQHSHLSLTQISKGQYFLIIDSEGKRYSSKMIKN